MPLGQSLPGNRELDRLHVRHRAEARRADVDRHLIPHGLDDVEPAVSVEVAERDRLGSSPGRFTRRGKPSVLEVPTERRLASVDKDRHRPIVGGVAGHKVRFVVAVHVADRTG